MISSDQWRAYNEAVESIRSAAEAEVRDAVLDWLNEHPEASVAEAREEAARIMRGAVQRHDKEAASLAAEWYDAQGRANGAALDRAVTAPAYSSDAVQTLARYQVRKYQAGDLAGFAAMCGEFAANDAMRSLNATVLRNARRDKAKGVRFARVTSGRNTCAFCLMLAGRGAVYWSRESAGAFNEWHRHCTCKVVPSYSGDKWETLVEGHDPRDAKRWSDRIASRLRLDGKLVIGSREELTNECIKLEEAFRSDEESALGMVSSSGMVSVEPGCHLTGKELQEAKWMSTLGHDVQFRNPDEHIVVDGNTSDALIDGQTWDFKRVTSSNPNKIAQHMLKKRHQGPNYLIDLVFSNMKEEEALCKVASVLDDERVASVMVITRNHVSLLTK